MGDLVAGVRIERTPSGYEPDELPLLYPATCEHITKSPFIKPI
jgi:hypothetical protein